jgi:hypothetical protein
MDIKEGVGKLVEPVLVVWNAIGWDVESSLQEAGEELDNESAIEMCLDANRLLINANDAEAEELLNQLCREHGFGRVVNELSQRITLA